MSYVCALCGMKMGSREKPVMVVTKFRQKVYPERLDHVDPDIIIDKGGVGLEIAKEVQSCPFCAKKN